MERYDAERPCHDECRRLCAESLEFATYEDTNRFTDPSEQRR
jgi:hypothetical protein